MLSRGNKVTEAIAVVQTHKTLNATVYVRGILPYQRIRTTARRLDSAGIWCSWVSRQAFYQGGTQRDVNYLVQLWSPWLSSRVDTGPAITAVS